MASHITSGPGKSWHQNITIDLFAHVLANSIFHPFVAWMIPLCLRAVQAPTSSSKFIGSCVYAAFITLMWMLSIVNKRLAYGIPREMNWDDEVIVITGGAGGLGRILAEIYAMRGASVAVLDLVELESASDGVQSYVCDVGDADVVEKVKERIKTDLGCPTILINNAGIVNGKPLWDLTAKDIQRNFNVNILSHFHTIRTFLPGMLSSGVGGTIITVSSVLGKVPASHLSDYCAAKAGLIAMHTALRSELASPTAPEGAEKIRTVLVTPGQLSTPLFEGLQTPSDFFGPVVEPVELAREIVKMVDEGMSGEISLPLYAKLIEWMHVLPMSLEKLARSLSGVDRAMERMRRKTR